MTFAIKLRQSFEELSKHLVGWDDILIQAMFALVTREHCFWLSEPGRAKSWAARMIFSMFPDAKTFAIQVTKDMMPSAIFGSEIAKEYIDNGKEVFNLEGGICTANFVFLDEFLDGPDFLVRSINTVLNERVFERKDQKTSVPLHSGIMTTNFDRYGTALEAVRDRMMCKAVIPTVGGLVDRMTMYDSYLRCNGHVPNVPQLSYAELLELAKKVESESEAEVSEGIRLLHAFLIHMFCDLRRRREKQRLLTEDPDREIKESDIKLDPITPRTEAKLHDFSRASALLNGRKAVRPVDLRALRYGLVTIGNGRVDNEAWTEICTTYLSGNVNDRQVSRLDDLASVARKVGEIKRLGTEFPDSAIRIAGKVQTYTRVTIMELLDSIIGQGTEATKVIANMLKSEITALSAQPITRFPWGGDWS